MSSEDLEPIVNQSNNPSFFDVLEAFGLFFEPGLRPLFFPEYVLFTFSLPIFNLIILFLQYLNNFMLYV